MDALERYLDQKAAEIAEHFDTVQIVATRHDGSDGGTFWITRGRGDSYARYGALKRAVLTDDGDSRRPETHRANPAAASRYRPKLTQTRARFALGALFSTGCSNAHKS